MKIAILGSYTTQFLVKSLNNINQNLEIYEAGYSQIDFEIINKNSELYNFKPDIVIIHETSISFKNNYFKNSDTKREYYINCIDRIENLIKNLKNILKSIEIIYPTIDFDNEMNFGNYYFKVPESIDYQLNAYNYELSRLAIKYKNFNLLDINNLVFNHGNVRDSRLIVSSDLHFTISFTKVIANSLNNLISAINGQFLKCIILDLDNTIWGGVIGDDGIESIKIGDLGIGKAFTEFQIWLKSLKERGIILCVCSKNDEHIAMKPFTDHPDMILSLEDIAVFVANWGNKVDNIKYIQSVLNIGFDSIIFLDDNPLERDMVKSNVKGIIVPDLPEDPAEYKSCLVKQNLFETTNYSSLDKERTKKYQAESKRKNLELTSFDLNSYLESLQMTAKIDNVSDQNIPRLAQLTQRTNQFNARTIRYNEADIKDLSNDAKYFIFSISLNDKFGSHGIVSCLILKKNEDESVFIDTFLMSCRVFSRGLEHFIIDHIILFMENQNIKFLTAEYIPSKKNHLIEKFYNSIGFNDFVNKKETINVTSINIYRHYIEREKE